MQSTISPKGAEILNIPRTQMAHVAHADQDCLLTLEGEKRDSNYFYVDEGFRVQVVTNVMVYSCTCDQMYHYIVKHGCRHYDETLSVIRKI